MAKTGFFQSSGSTATTENDIQTQVTLAQTAATNAATSATAAANSATAAANSATSAAATVASISDLELDAGTFS